MERQEEQHSEALQETARAKSIKETLNHETGPPSELALKVQQAKVSRVVKPQEIVHKTARAEAAENFGEDRADPPSVSEGKDEQIEAEV